MRIKEMANHLWHSHRGTLILLAALLVINVVLYVTLQQFVTPRVVEQEKRFLKRQAEVRQILHNQAGASRSPEQMYVFASQDISRFYQAVPEYQEFTGLIEELLVLSNNAKLNITQIGYNSEAMKGSPLLKFSLNFNVSGDYKQIKKFIYSLEQSSRLIGIKQISLQGENGDIVSLQIAMETFFQTGGRES